MASGVAAVWVPVSDMQRAVAFYRDALGLTVASESDDWSEIDANGLRLGLNARESATPSEGGGAVVTFQPDGSLEDEVADLRSKGAEFTGDIVSTRGDASSRSRTARATTGSCTRPQG